MPRVHTLVVEFRELLFEGLPELLTSVPQAFKVRSCFLKVAFGERFLRGFQALLNDCGVHEPANHLIPNELVQPKVEVSGEVRALQRVLEATGERPRAARAKLVQVWERLLQPVPELLELFLKPSECRAALQQELVAHDRVLLLPSLLEQLHNLNDGGAHRGTLSETPDEFILHDAVKAKFEVAEQVGAGQC